jgi:hypothetical protein
VDQILPSLVELLAPFRGCFRQEAFLTFQHVVAAWAVGWPSRRSWGRCAWRCGAAVFSAEQRTATGNPQPPYYATRSIPCCIASPSSAEMS